MRLFDLSGGLCGDWTEKVCEPRVYVFDPCAEIEADTFLALSSVNFQSSDNLGVPFSAVIGTIISSNSVCAVHSYGRELEAFEVGGNLDVDETTDLAGRCAITKCLVCGYAQWIDTFSIGNEIAGYE